MSGHLRESSQGSRKVLLGILNVWHRIRVRHCRIVQLRKGCCVPGQHINRTLTCLTAMTWSVNTSLMSLVQTLIVMSYRVVVEAKAWTPELNYTLAQPCVRFQAGLCLYCTSSSATC